MKQIRKQHLQINLLQNSFLSRSSSNFSMVQFSFLVSHFGSSIYHISTVSLYGEHGAGFPEQLGVQVNFGATTRWQAHRSLAGIPKRSRPVDVSSCFRKTHRRAPTSLAKQAVYIIDNRYVRVQSRLSKIEINIKIHS